MDGKILLNITICVSISLTLLMPLIFKDHIIITFAFTLKSNQIFIQRNPGENTTSGRLSKIYNPNFYFLFLIDNKQIFFLTCLIHAREEYQAMFPKITHGVTLPGFG